ncbi:outer membrane protein OmpA-like peptidoglycan-associated protein [Paracidovorax anthurii]|uniref:Outer membrane protein OmpA-like peptidoglycan-associated protein n=1 Tax=Paracidovorax anthurii TaxID=78229 RepID=A0A328ZFY2_9BURK|nr:outer membrane protein OmpA-like peptidoglycan-associated protein [Paracidovorax anthurii]
MRSMRSYSQLLGLLCCAVVLGGCAGGAPGQAGSGAPAEPQAPAAAPAPAPAPEPAPAPAAPRVPEDGTIAEFTGTDATLPPEALALLDVVAADKSSATQRWEIKGYSDRKAVKNAREVALARALAVRKELVARGIPTQNLRVMYSTAQEREAVTVLPR